MIRTPKYIINSKPFTSQEAIKKHFQEVLRHAVLDQALAGETLEDCIELFKRHPEWTQKKGCGIDSVRVIENPVYGDRCFWIYRTDGTDTDISYLSCVKSKAKSPRSQFMAAARNAVVDQILDFKRQAYNGRFMVHCQITGKLVAESDADVDHVFPFVRLVDRFITQYHIDIDAVEYKNKGDGDIVTCFENDIIEKKWKKFHLKHAKLQITHRKANQSKGSKDGSTDTRLLP